MPRILTLDCGGTRGLSSLLILRGIMQVMQREKGTTHEPLRPCKFFDLIVGTGTGGISALLLGRMRLTIEEAIVEYTRIAQAFQRPSQYSTVSTLYEAFETDTLEFYLNDVVRDHFGDAGALLYDPDATDPTQCHTAVLAKKYGLGSTAPPYVFRNYSVPQHFTIVEAALATCAMARLFPPVKLGSSPPIEFWDAGYTGFNNPTEFALEEVGEIWSTEPLHLVLSLGTGVEILADGGLGLQDLSQRVVNDCRAVHERVCRVVDPKVYFRFDVDRGLEDLGLKEWERVGDPGRLGSITRKYLGKNEVNKHVISCMEVLSSGYISKTVGHTSNTVGHLSNTTGTQPALQINEEQAQTPNPYQGHPSDVPDTTSQVRVSSANVNYQIAFQTTSPLCLNGRIRRPSQHPSACGGYSDVFEGFLGNQLVAIKVPRPWTNSGAQIPKDKLLKRLWREFLSWTSLTHENVLSLVGYSFDFSPEQDIPCLVAPWMSNGTVNSYIAKNPATDRMQMLLGIAKGLSYLHSLDPAIAHGDLRGNNILVSDSGVPCLSDFGLSKILDEVRGLTMSSSFAGSLRWMSPEIIRGAKASLEGDVWAYGMTVLELLSGSEPYREIPQDIVVMGQIMDGQVPSRPSGESISDLLDGDMWAVCRQCWARVSSDRSSMDRVTTLLSAMQIIQGLRKL